MSKFWKWTLISMGLAAWVGYLAGGRLGPNGDFLGLFLLAPAYALIVLVLALVGRFIVRLFRPRSKSLSR